MGALTGFIWVIAAMVALGALVVVALYVARARYIAAGQEEGE